MLVAIFICGLIGFIALKLWGKCASVYERNTLRIVGVCLVIAFIAVVIGFILCIIQLVHDFNVTNWVTIIAFIWNIVYAFFTGGIPEIEIRYAIGYLLVIFGTIFSIVGYATIDFLIWLAHI